jgi:hypothetical protein
MVLTAMFAGEPVCLVDYGRDQIEQLGREEHQARYRYGEKILACPDCRGPLHLYRPLGIIIFRHDPGHSHAGIAGRGESGRHDFLKLVACDSARQVDGWTAAVEVPLEVPDPDTGGHHRVDVLASKGLIRHGFEIQLSPATPAAITARQEVRLGVGGLRECVWATETLPDWSRDVAWARLDDDRDRPHVIDGIVEWSDQAGDYQPVAPMTLRRFVARQLGDRLHWVDYLGRMRDPTARRNPPRAKSDRKTDPRHEHNLTERCDRDPVPETRESSGLRSEWRPVPNLPGIPQYTEAPIGARVALCDQYRNAQTDQEAAQAMAELIALHRNALHPNTELE